MKPFFRMSVFNYSIVLFSETTSSIKPPTTADHQAEDEDDDDDEVISRSARKVTKEGEDRSKSKRRRKIQLIADSDSENEESSGNSEKPSKATTVGGIHAEMDNTVTELAAVSGLVKSNNDGAKNEDDTAYSVKLFSESTGSVFNLTTSGASAVADNMQE